MAKPTPTASGRPVAPGVDPITPVQPQPQDTTRTQDAATLGQDNDAAKRIAQEDRPAAPDANPVVLNDQSPNLTKDDGERPLSGAGATPEVEMVKVKTKGDYMLMDPYSTKSIDKDGAEVPVTSFINDELAEGGRLEKA
jgi:hypothetical protein